MRVKTFTFLCVALVAVVSAAAQDVAPPPGFVPGQEIEAAPGAAAESYVPYQDAYPRQGAGPDQDFTHPGTADSFWTNQTPPGPILFGPDVTPFPRLWLRAEALYWWTKDSPLPVPIVTDGGPIGSGSSVLIGNQDISFPGRGGGRFTFGFSLDAEQSWALEGSYFFLANSSVSQGVSSDGGIGSPTYAIPYFDPTTNSENITYISRPGFYAGTAVLTVQNFLQGADANLLYNVQNADGVRWDVLGGFRYVNLQENLTFTTDSPDLPPVGPDIFRTFDRFTANNNFYGAQIGARVSYDNSRLFMNATGKLALGSTVETVGVNGGFITNINGGFFSSPGGYFAQPTNIGTQSRSQFAVVPEVNLNFGVRMSPWASFVVGYSFLYISSVARPGDQIDRVINPNQSPAISNNFPASLSGAARPGLSIRDTDFWAQGLNFALEFRY